MKPLFIIIFGIIFGGICIALILLIMDSKARVKQFKERLEKSDERDMGNKILSMPKIIFGNDPSGESGVSYAVWVSSVERDKLLFEMEQKMESLKKELEEVKSREMRRSK